MKNVLTLLFFLFLKGLCAQNWQNAFYFGSPKGDGMQGLHLAPGGDLYISGTAGDTLQLGPSTLLPPGNFSYGFISRFRKNGQPLWGKAVYTNRGQSAQKFLFPFYSAPAPDGGVILSGHFSDIMILGADTLKESAGGTFAAKLDSQGNYIWARNFGQPNVSGSNEMSLSNPAVDHLGNIYFVCSITQSARFKTDTLSAANGRLYIIKFDAQGTEQWVRQCGTSGYSSRVFNLQTDQDGFIYFTGSISRTAIFGTDTLVVHPSRTIAYLCKMDGNGHFKWARKAGATTRNDISGSIASVTYGTAIGVNTFDRVYLGGFFMDTVMIGTQKLDPLCGDDYCNNLFLASYDKNGTFKWVRQSPAGTKSSAVNSMLSDAKGNIYLSGSFTSGISFNGFGVFNNLPFPGRDCFIAKFNAGGNCQWIRNYGMDLNNLRMDVDCDKGDIYTGSNWTGAPGNLVAVGLPATSHYENFVAVISSEFECGVISGVRLAERNETLRLWPNPATDEVRLDVPENYAGGRLELFDARGMLVSEEQAESDALRLRIGHLPPGIYTVVLTAESGARGMGRFFKN